MLKGPVLVCIDFSEASLFALRAGALLAEKENTTLHVLHVCELPIQWDWMPSGSMEGGQEQSLIQKTLGQLSTLLLKERIKGDMHVFLGTPYQAVMAFIEKEQPGLIVTGHRGKGLSPVVPGGLATKLLSTADRPVLIVKTPLKGTKVSALIDPLLPAEEILQWTQWCSKKLSCPWGVVALIEDIFSRYSSFGNFGARVMLQNLSPQEEEELKGHVRKRVMDLLPENSDASVHIEVGREKGIAYHLNAILTRDYTNVAVMLRHQKNFMEKIFIGSETRRMLEIFEGNLLVLPPKKENA